MYFQKVAEINKCGKIYYEKISQNTKAGRKKSSIKWVIIYVFRFLNIYIKFLYEWIEILFIISNRRKGRS